MRSSRSGWTYIGATPGPASAPDAEPVRLELVKDGDRWLIARAAPEPPLAR
jgi:hypothetical protein